MELLVVDGSVTGSTIQSALDDPVPEVEWDMPPDLDDPDGTAAPAAAKTLPAAVLSEKRPFPEGRPYCFVAPVPEVPYPVVLLISHLE